MNLSRIFLKHLFKHLKIVFCFSAGFISINLFLISFLSITEVQIEKIWKNKTYFSFDLAFVFPDQHSCSYIRLVKFSNNPLFIRNSCSNLAVTTPVEYLQWLILMLILLTLPKVMSIKTWILWKLFFCWEKPKQLRYNRNENLEAGVYLDNESKHRLQ